LQTYRQPVRASGLWNLARQGRLAYAK
jgi:hypothetical protein